jgi:deoxyribonuclease-4
MKIGAHVSGAGGLDLAFGRAEAMGAECFQIFLSAPQRWLDPEIKTDVIERFKANATTTQIGPNFVHGSYLINLGADSSEHLEKSITWLRYGLNSCGKLGIKGVIFHIGSHKGNGFDNVKTQVSESIKKILSTTPDNVELILETSAGAGGNIGGTFEELAELIKLSNDKRVKVCMDTAHVFASGVDLRTVAGVEKAITDFDNTIGLDKLVVVQANDSKVDFGSNRDRHENIGEGFIGQEGFKNILANKRLAEVPFILEVPGFKDEGPDKENIDILKKLRSA